MIKDHIKGIVLLAHLCFPLNLQYVYHSFSQVISLVGNNTVNTHIIIRT